MKYCLIALNLNIYRFLLLMLALCSLSTPVWASVDDGRQHDCKKISINTDSSSAGSTLARKQVDYSTHKVTHLPCSVQEKVISQIIKSGYEVSFLQELMPGGGLASHLLSNRAQDMTALLGMDGVALIPGTAEDSSQYVQLSLYGYGFGHEPLMVNKPITPRIEAAGNRVNYNYGSFSEWYINDKNGIEHGVTIQQPLVDEGHGQFQIAWQVEGLTPRLSKDGSVVEFFDSDQALVFRYGTIIAWDAEGRQLAANLAVSDNIRSTLTWQVDLKGAVYPITIDPLFTQVKKITAFDEAQYDSFGVSVSVSGTTLVVGARGDDNPGNTGSVYIFQKDQGGANNWGLVKKISPTGGNLNDLFGSSVSIFGDTLIVGAYGDNTIGSYSGAAYIFQRDHGGINYWGQVKKILAVDSEAAVSFGYSVSLFGDSVVVGSYKDNDAGSQSGSAYIFQKDQGGADNWGQVTKITAADGAADDYFGWSVSISGDSVVVGAKGDNEVGAYSSGSSYIFQRDHGGVDNWGQVKKNRASDAQNFDEFGFSVSISNDIVVVGARKEDHSAADSGSAYIFQKDLGGVDNWGELKKIYATDGAASDSFGTSVSIDGDVLAVGADGNNIGSGSVYIFKREEGGADNWGQVENLTASDGTDYDYFGSSLSLSGSILVAGAARKDGAFDDTGSVYLFGDATPSVSLSLSTGPFDENGGIATVTATLSAISNQDVTVNLSFGGTASAGDYSRSSDIIVIPAGDLSAETTLTGIDDTIYDPAETIIVDVSSVVNSSENGIQQVTATITDDEPEPTISLSLSGSPVHENGGVATITATLSGLSDLDTTVNLDVSGSASPGDYSIPASDIIIPAGSLSESISLTGINDSLHDPGETVIVDISTVINGSEDGIQQVTATITDDELEPTVSLSLSGSPFDENGGIGTVTATLSGASGRDVTVDLGFSGTATVADYTPSSNSIVIPAQSLFSTGTLTGIDDLVIDMDETVVIDILSVTNATEDAMQQVTAVITDDDLPLPNFVLYKKKLAYDGQTSDYFGYSVSISGDFAVVGAYGDDDKGGNAGSAYVFQNNLGGAFDDWTFVKKITAGDGDFGDEFGYSVSISGDTMVIGARSDLNSPNGWTGSAYVFDRNRGGADLWGLVKKLVPPDGVDFGFFGKSVSSFGDTVVIGASRDDDNGSESGSAYIFQKDWGGIDNWGQITKITAFDGASGDEFGGTVAAGVDTVFIAAEGDDSLSGSVYVFKKDMGDVTNWNFVKKITSSDGIGGDIFGRSLAATDNTLAVGASNKSSVYIFKKDLGGLDNWGQANKITATGGSTNDGFGQSVSLSDHTLIVGAHGDDDTGVDAGAAYVYRSNNGGADNWGQVQKLTASDGAASDFFGYSVAVSGSSSIVGAYADDDRGTDSGSGYIFSDANELPEVSLALTGGNPFAENGGSTTISAILSEISSQDVTVYLTFTGTASSSDYTFSSDHIVIPAGSLSGSITLTGSDDVVYDPDETVVVDISVLVAASEKDGFQQVVAVITDDEIPVVVTLGLSSDQFDENGGTTTITATLSGLVDQDVTVNLGFSGTASGADYAIPDNFIFIPTGDLSASAVITGTDDTLVELTESLIIDISSVIYAAEDGVQQVTVTINDDELVLTNMHEFKKILASNGTENDTFGYSVSIFNDWAAIGAYGYNDLKGAVYIFQKDEGGVDNWGVVREIIPNNQSQERFGFSLDISENFLIVGEPENYTAEPSNRHGSAYIYQKDEGGPDNWGWVKTVDPPELPSGDFGNSVSVSGDTVVIGSSYAVGGRIYNIFKLHQGGTDNWGLVKSIVITDGTDSTLSIDGDIVIIGDAGDDANGLQAGSAHIFYKDLGGVDNWGWIKKLAVPDGAAGDRFGYSVSISGSQVIVGAVGDESNAGSSYLFRRDQGGTDSWGQVAKIIISGGLPNEYFGTSVSLLNDIAVIGRPGDGNGSAYVFQKDTGGFDNWGQVTKFTASDGAADDNFGGSVDLSPDTIIVGASHDDDKGSGSGSAYLFSFNVAGDVDHDGSVGLSDIIRALDVMTGGMPAIGLNGDINSDGRIGMADIIYIMRQVADSP